MLLRLKHVKPVKRRLASGELATYYYHRVTGKRILGEPGSETFLKNYSFAGRLEASADPNSIAGLILEFRASGKFDGLRDRTKADYEKHLDAIKTKFGAWEVEAFEDHRVRKDIMEWREKLAKKSRKQADYAMAVLRLLLQWAYDQGKLAINHATRTGKLYTPDRSDKIWGKAEIEALLKKAGEPVKAAFLLALDTGQRQGDLLALLWSAYDGKAITLRQSKGRRKVYLPCTAELRAVLSRLKAAREQREKSKKPVAATILTGQRGRPWTGSGFRTMFDRAKADAGIDGLTFHDLRGTFVTRASERGATPQEIATITGHSVKEVERILDAYLARTPELARKAMRKYERGTKTENSGGKRPKAVSAK